MSATTPEQASHATQMLRECGDHHSAAIISSLAEQVKALTNEVAFFKNAAAKFCTDLAFVEAERDSLKAAGAQMANCMYNYSQRAGRELTLEMCANLKELQQRWDAARVVQP